MAGSRYETDSALYRTSASVGESYFQHLVHAGQFRRADGVCRDGLPDPRGLAVSVRQNGQRRDHRPSPQDGDAPVPPSGGRRHGPYHRSHPGACAAGSHRGSALNLSGAVSRDFRPGEGSLRRTAAAPCALKAPQLYSAASATGSLFFESSAVSSSDFLRVRRALGFSSLSLVPRHPLRPPGCHPASGAAPDPAARCRVWLRPSDGADRSPAGGSADDDHGRAAPDHRRPTRLFPTCPHRPMQRRHHRSCHDPGRDGCGCPGGCRFGYRCDCRSVLVPVAPAATLLLVIVLRIAVITGVALTVVIAFLRRVLRDHHPVIVIRVLVVVFNHHPVAGGRRVPRQRLVLFVQLCSGPAQTDAGPVAVKGLIAPWPPVLIVSGRGRGADYYSVSFCPE